MCFQGAEFRGILLCKEVSPEPPSRNSYHLWLADFLGREIGKPEPAEKFYERGLERNLFSTRISPDYFLRKRIRLIPAWSSVASAPL
jgi:hypothetical protein